MKITFFLFFLSLFDLLNFLPDSPKIFTFNSLSVLTSQYQEGLDYKLFLENVNEFDGTIKFNNSKISFECQEVCYIISLDCSFVISNGDLAFKNIIFNISSSNGKEFFFLAGTNSSITLQVNKKSIYMYVVKIFFNFFFRIVRFRKLIRD